MEICMPRNFLFIHLWHSRITTERPYGVPDQQILITGLCLWPLEHRCAIHNDSHIMCRLSLTRDFQSEWRATENALYLPLVRHRRHAEREREREFYFSPARPRYEHMAVASKGGIPLRLRGVSKVQASGSFYLSIVHTTDYTWTFLRPKHWVLKELMGRQTLPFLQPLPFLPVFYVFLKTQIIRHIAT